MNHREIARLSLKLAGVFALVEAVPMLQGVTSLASSYEYFSGSGEGLGLIVLAALVPFLLLVCGGVALIRYSDRLAPRFLPEPTDPVTTSPISRADVQAMAFSIVGVVVLVLAVPKIIRIISQFIALRGPEFSDASQGLWRSTWTTVIALGTQLLLGIYLFFGGRSLARFWERMQETRPMRKDGD